MTAASAATETVLAAMICQAGTGLLMSAFQLEPRCSTRHTREASTASPTARTAML